MGYFSWKTSDTDVSISNRDSSRGALPSVMVDKDNNYYVELCYLGYGVFNNKDAFELLAEMNYSADEIKSYLSISRINTVRDMGIELACSGNPIKYPLKFISYGGYLKKLRYEDLPASPTCEAQGFIY